MHWRFTYLGAPSGLSVRLTTVKHSGPVVRRAAKAFSSEGGSGSLLASAQAASQPRQPTHSVVSTRTEVSSSPATGTRPAAWAGPGRETRAAVPVAPATFRKVRLPSFMVVSPGFTGSGNAVEESEHDQSNDGERGGGDHGCDTFFSWTSWSSVASS